MKIKLSLFCCLGTLILSTVFQSIAYADVGDVFDSLIRVGMQAGLFGLLSAAIYFYLSRSKMFRLVITFTLFGVITVLLSRLLFFRILGIEDFKSASENSTVGILIVGFWIACFVAAVGPLATALLFARKRYLVSVCSLIIWFYPIAYPAFLLEQANRIKETTTFSEK